MRARNAADININKGEAGKGSSPCDLRESGSVIMNSRTIPVLLIEDNPTDVLLIREFLSTSVKVPYRLTHADRLTSGLAHMRSGAFSIVLLDLDLPDGSGLGTFEAVHAEAPGMPVIVLTGNNDDGVAIEAVQKGAQDYLVKDQVTAGLLDRAIRYANERQKLLSQIEQSRSEIKTLRGYLPICASCKKIRDDKGYWTQIEAYISARSDVEFSHGLCLDCFHRLYPDLPLPGDEASVTGDHRPK